MKPRAGGSQAHDRIRNGTAEAHTPTARTVCAHRFR
jgi:hypothetical protein